MSRRGARKAPWRASRPFFAGVSAWRSAPSTASTLLAAVVALDGLDAPPAPPRAPEQLLVVALDGLDAPPLDAVASPLREVVALSSAELLDGPVVVGSVAELLGGDIRPRTRAMLS